MTKAWYNKRIKYSHPFLKSLILYLPSFKLPFGWKSWHVWFKTCRGFLTMIEYTIFDWLIDWLLFYVPLENVIFINMEGSPLPVKIGKKTCSFWAVGNLYPLSTAVSRDLGFWGLVRRVASLSRLVQQGRHSNLEHYDIRHLNQSGPHHLVIWWDIVYMYSNLWYFLFGYLIHQ